MIIHAIALRAAWQWRLESNPEAPWNRIDLPTGADQLPSGRIMLVRRFQTPRLSTQEHLGIDLENCIRLVRIRLNGEDLPCPPPDQKHYQIEFEPHRLRPSNELELTHDSTLGLPIPGPQLWGVVRLLVLRAEDRRRI